MIDKVSIFGIPHTVRYAPDNFKTGDTHFGEIDFAKCEIIINRDMPEEAQRETLIHEIVHGMLVMIGRNDLSDDETLVQSLALAISQTFELNIEEQDNLPIPKFVDEDKTYTEDD